MCMTQQEKIIIRDLYGKARFTVDAGVNIAKDSVNTRLVLLLTRGRRILSQHACRNFSLTRLI